MISISGETRANHRALGPLRAAASIGAVTGAVGSAGLTLYAGLRVGSPRLLLALFAIWVLLPFAAVLAGFMMSRRWSMATRVGFYSGTLLLAVASITVYGVVALAAARPKTAVFVVLSPTSFVFMAVAVPVAAFMVRRSASYSDGAASGRQGQ